MACRPHGLSRTLPKNFTFSSSGEPRTPERVSHHLDVPPPPPRHSSCRLRRSRVRSGTDVFAQAEYDLSTFNPNPSDVPIPSIEVPSYDAFAGPSCPAVPSRDDRFLAPPRDRLAMKTPPAQIRPDPIEDNNTASWSLEDPQALGESIQRPSSVCSQASDSSVSSIETFSSRRSAGGSCTSMESDSYDPFFHLELPPKPAPETPSLCRTRNKNKARMLHAKERWTLDMDNHLWNTYQLYIQDPTITPFKMTPGSIPPLGVTHRVAREAKRTWERRRFRLDRQFPFALSYQRPSSNSTPTPKVDAVKPTWPKSEASTRRRLKLLCRKKFSIAPHYQRMMQSRSPTPFLDLLSQPSAEPSRAVGPTNSCTAYATRDLGVSLVSSSVPGPLAQLAAEDSSPPMSNEWFNNPILSAPRQLIPEPPTIHPGTAPRLEPVPRLGSPFTYNTWGPNASRKRPQRHTPRARRETIHVTGSRLRSPPRMEPFPNVDHHQHLAPYVATTSESPAEQDTRVQLEDLVRQGKLNDLGQHRIRIRNRGATISSVNHKGLDQLFSPPSSSSRNDEDTMVGKPIVNPMLNLSGDSIKRLGSPFKVETPKRAQPSPRRIRHAPSLSDPFASGLIPTFQPTSPNSQSKNEEMASRLPYDPTEQGISDAERIRRQILNMPYSRQ
ncbi:hypothetical protein CBS115989_8911 [Aspergillus niger]|uniref:Uncharacterized protein n=3 Tax=Aspergillus niger TaxID=5061 RepID=A2QVM9_ASPNC|nr:hypothetical protein An11g01990 [Aspergillus niger]XP_025454699.1 uncharacterized protein BO96DRAFT_48436 [Aspergillus niger CBS 101883]RDH15700.1 hypothetical protein M747DRAFT_129874 [Aspergillus niger ATCC 13496]KAI2814030.1 hypothetical protein CBS115989_8911 [Aspergillus niger]KAI2835692.1 hypothetical protein CBS11350_9893 [Aspergillus niger]KAI2841390.1 hypothetical protein CBS11232_8820 [Aspergillus niger]KAI2874731.1 hypothetical protein CBS115988_5932 [Aspergillus niger]|eukprot:XP_001394203.1 hypothetical protein ANI_1_274094 [Aspergillus niger CBS 513.88]